MTPSNAKDDARDLAWGRNAIAFLRERGLETAFSDWCGGWPVPVAKDDADDSWLYRHSPPSYEIDAAHDGSRGAPRDVRGESRNQTGEAGASNLPNAKDDAVEAACKSCGRTIGTGHTIGCGNDDVVEVVMRLLAKHRRNRYADESLADDALIDRVNAEEIVAAIEAMRAAHDGG